MKKMTSFKQFKKELLNNKDFEKNYNDLELEFSLIRQVISKRISKGLSQQDLAKKIGTKQSAISRFESGKYNPTVMFLKKVSEALNSRLDIKI